MPARLETIGKAPKWNDYLPTGTDVNQMNGRVKRCHNLTLNLTKMMRVAESLNGDFGPVTGENLILARRLTWIMFYFYGAMFGFASWIFAQTSRRSVVQQGEVCSVAFLTD